MKTNFVKLAKDMIAAGEAVDLARRYLSIRRRHLVTLCRRCHNRIEHGRERLVVSRQ